jgi:transcription-repair coupling factor (superfamily II helicase)
MLLSERQCGHVQVFGPVLYSHLPKLASEKADDRAADLWVPDLNVPVADMLPTSCAIRGGSAGNLHPRRRMPERRRTGRPRGGNFPSLRQIAAGSPRFLCGGKPQDRLLRKGIVRPYAGPEAAAATLLPGRLRKSRARSLQRDGDRVVYISKGREGPLRKAEEFLDLLDE